MTQSPRLLPSAVVALLVAVLGVPVSAQEDNLQVRVAIGPMSAPADDAALTAICTAVRSTVSLTLRLLGTYRVSEAPAVDAYADEKAALRHLAEGRLDNLIFGRALRDKDGAVVLELSVLDRERGEVTITKSERAATSMDVFDAADALSVGLLQTFSGIHIGFGAVELVRTGEAGEFTVTVDGEEAGQKVTKLSKLLNGHHVIEVRQRRMLGQEVLLRQEVDVVEEGTSLVEFTIPYVLPEEADALATIDRGIAATWNDRSASAQLSSLLSRAVALLADVRYSPRLGELAAGYRQKRGKHALLENRWRIESARFSPDTALVEELLALSAETSQYPEPEPLVRSRGENANLLVGLLRVSADRLLADGKWAGAEATVEAAARLVPLATGLKAGLFEEERAYLRTVLAGYETRRKQPPRLLAPAGLAAVGAALGGLSVWLFADGTAAKLAAQAAALYQSAGVTTPAELKQLRQSIQSAYLRANLAKAAAWGGAVLGPAALALGIGLAISEMTAPLRHLRADVDSFFSRRTRAAKAALATGFWSPRATLVMTDPPGMPLSVGEAPVRESPAAILDVSGATITSTDGWVGDLTGTVGAEAGSTLLLLRDERAREPDGPAWVFVMKLPGRQYEVTWAALPGATSYSLEIDRLDGDYSAPVEIVHALTGDRFVYTAPPGIEGELRARVCAFDANRLRSRWRVSLKP